MALQTITKDILTRTSGAALLNLPYDVSFLAGYDSDTEGEDVVVRKYGELVMARPGTFVGEVAYLDTQCTGTNLEMDVLKNGETIYSGVQNPKFGISSSTHTPGVLSVTTFASGDRITFTVLQVGSINPGKGVRFMLKCKV